MDIMLRLRTARRLAWLLTSAIAVPYLSVAAVAAPKTPAPTPRSVVVFPVESAESVSNPRVGDELNTQLRDALSTYPGYRVVIYNERLPAVQRLVAMQPDKKLLLSGPFTPNEAGVQKAMSLGKSMSADLLVVGMVEKYVFNAESGTADVTIRAQVLDATTGKSVQTVAVTGRGVGKTTRLEGVSESAVVRDAVRDTTRKFMKTVTGVDYQEPVQSTQAVVASGKSKKQSWVPMLLLSLGVGLLLGGGGGHSSGSSGGDTGGVDPPPPPPSPM